jgi:hypothetical protein
MIIAGDIGGTKCNLAVFEEHGRSLPLVFKRRYATSEFSSLEELIEKFFSECGAESGAMPEGSISAARFGVAGAVVDGRLYNCHSKLGLARALGSDGGGRHLRSCVLDNREEFPRILNDDFRFVCFQGVGLNQFSADA